MVDPLQARVEAIEHALIGVANALGPRKDEIVRILDFVAVQTAKGKSSKPAIATACEELRQKLG